MGNAGDKFNEIFKSLSKTGHIGNDCAATVEFGGKTEVMQGRGAVGAVIKSEADGSTSISTYVKGVMSAEELLSLLGSISESVSDKLMERGDTPEQALEELVKSVCLESIDTLSRGLPLTEAENLVKRVLYRLAYALE